MMVVSDPTALFTFPFLVYLSGRLFELLNELGVLYIPFLVAIARAWSVARAQGDDEGSSQIMALKFLERDFIAKFTILILCVAPISLSGVSTAYKQFSTSSMPSLIQGAETVTELKPNSAVSDLWGHSSMPLAFGLVHESIMGITNVMIAKLPCSIEQGSDNSCSTDGNLSFLTYYLGEVTARNDNHLVKKIVQFHSQCYLPAYKRHTDAQNNGYAYIPPNPNAYPYTSNVRMSFYGDLMFHYYGEVLTNEGSTLKELFVGNNEDQEYCSVVSEELYDDIKGYINGSMRDTDRYEAFIGGWTDLFSRYSGQNTDGSINVSEVQANRTEAMQAVLNSIYTNTVNVEYKKSPHLFTSGDTSRDTAIKAMLELNATSGNTDVNSVGEKSIKETVQYIAMSAIHLISVGVETLSKMTELYLASITIPTLIHISLGTIILTGPLVIVLSSYDGTITARIFIVYIGLAFSIYIYEATLVLTNNILVMALDYDMSALYMSSNVHGLGNNAAQAQRMMLVGLALQLIPLSSVLIWNVLLQVLGGRALKTLMAGSNANTDLFKSPVYALSKNIGDQTTKEILDNLKEKAFYDASMEALDEFESNINSRIDSQSDPRIEGFIKEQNERFKKEQSSFSLNFGGGDGSDIDSDVDSIWDEYFHSGESENYSFYDDEDGYYSDSDEW